MGAEQGTVQLVNRTIRDFADDPRIPPEEEWEFFCECGCFALVAMTLATFDAGEGVWAPGHRVRTAGTPGPGTPSA